MHDGILVVTAVAAEAEAVRAGLAGDTVTVAPVGVGPAAAAAGTARLIALAEAAGRPYRESSAPASAAASPAGPRSAGS
ncbi:hypothetical protein GCM10027615_07780 [Plantactinospora veratri]